MEDRFSPQRIAEFWSQHPCGSHFVNEPEWRAFFEAYDRFKYSTEPHILQEIKTLPLAGARLLEVGPGQGAEAQQLIKRGAEYYGVDLTRESVVRVRTRFALFGLPYRMLAVASGDGLPFADATFDVVFTHGVIHHSPRIREIVREIHRVLKPGGRTVVMVYHRHSVNYQVSIRILRRLGILALFIPGVTLLVAKLMKEPVERLAEHRRALRHRGLRYLRMNTFIHHSTDGPENVYSGTFTKAEAVDLFPEFVEVTFVTHFLNERHFPVVRHLLPRFVKRWVERRWGWHLWIHAVKPVGSASGVHPSGGR